MPEPLSPEEDLNEELQKQEREIHQNLFLLHQLFDLVSDQNLSSAELLTKAQSIIDKFKQSNSIIAKEIEEIFATKDRQKIQDYFENEKVQLIQVLSDEIKQHKEINRRINKNLTEEFPTDS